ncbi:MAG: helix-turn-helix domain-containing protein, partial [Propionibacterium sp.]
MTLNDEGDVQGHRRRGPALEAALLDAAWQVLLEVGYDELTFEAVAAVAGTSRAVLYRRWPAKPELVRAAAVRALGADQHPF